MIKKTKCNISRIICVAYTFHLRWPMQTGNAKLRKLIGICSPYIIRTYLLCIILLTAIIATPYRDYYILYLL